MISAPDTQRLAIDEASSGDPYPTERDLPLMLRAAVGRHRGNLAQFRRSLRQAGMDHARVEAAIGQITEPYRLELREAIRAFAPGGLLAGES